MVRPARPTDRRKLARMRLALWPDSDEAELDAVLAVPTSRGITLVAESDDGRLVGFAELAVRPFADGCHTSPVAYLEGIWVDPEARRGGTASKLVREGEAWARSLGLTEIASDCEIDNRVSLEFHLASGFEEVQRSICFRRSLVAGPHP